MGPAAGVASQTGRRALALVRAVGILQIESCWVRRILGGGGDWTRTSVECSPSLLRCEMGRQRMIWYVVDEPL